MHLYAIQLDIAWENREANFAKVTSLLEKESIEPGALVSLPEMFAAGFSMNVPKIADDDSQTETFLRQTAKRFNIYLIGGRIARDSSGRGLNQALVVNPAGEVQSRYTKIHPFVQEADHYAPGDQIITTQCGEFTVAPFICYDLRFPEIFRIAASRGANVIVVIASWPSPRVDHWTTLLKARAIENQSYVLGVNRCGNDPHLSYPGKSVIYDPRGKILTEAGAEECAVKAQASLSDLQQYRRELPFLNDRRERYL